MKKEVEEVIVMHAGLKMEEGDQLPGFQQPVEVEKGKEMHPTEPTEKNAAVPAS